MTANPAKITGVREYFRQKNCQPTIPGKTGFDANLRELPLIKAKLVHLDANGFQMPQRSKPTSTPIRVHLRPFAVKTQFILKRIREN